MRQIFIPIALLLLLSCCKKNPPQSELSKLPPETQTGANTFGCLVNGQAFLPHGSSLAGPVLDAYYQLVDGGYYFVVFARFRNSSNGSGSSIGLFGDSIKVSENLRSAFKSRVKSNFSAGYSSYIQGNPYHSSTTDGNNFTGELWIKKFDTVKQVVSGTFWFNAEDSLGKKIEIREGRFDMHYTR